MFFGARMPRWLSRGKKEKALLPLALFFRWRSGAVTRISLSKETELFNSEWRTACATHNQRGRLGNGVG
jgi:hypothetical protein